MNELICKEEVYALVGAAMEVYNTLGAGFLEGVYHEALGFELAAHRIPFESQKELPVFYKGQHLRKTYIADFIAYGKVVLEIKALEALTGREEAQLLNYLKATSLEVGLLINFGGHRDLQWKRMAATTWKRGPAAPRRFIRED